MKYSLLTTVLLLFTCFVINMQPVAASWHYQSDQTVEQRHYSKKELRKLKKKQRGKFKKARKAANDGWGKASSIFGWVYFIGALLLFVIGLAIQVKGLWIAGLLMVGIPMFAAIIFLIVFVLLLAFGNYQLC